MIGVRHPLWKKAPLRLTKQPSLAAAIALGAMLVVVVSTAYPLFLSASDSELFATTMARPTFTPYGAGLGYRSLFVPFAAKAPDGGSLRQEQHDAFARIAATDAGFGRVAETMAAPALTAVAPGSPAEPSEPGRLFAGTNALAHVQIVSGTDGNGVWLPDNIANTLHLGPGDTVELSSGVASVDVTVDGVYVALVNGNPDGYWQIWHDQVLLSCKIDCSPPPQFIIADPGQLIELQRRLGRPSADEAFVAPVRTDPPMTLSEARSLRSTIGGLVNQMYAKGSALSGLFPCCRARSAHAMGTTTLITTQMDGLVKIVEDRSEGLRGPATVLLVAGLAIAFVVVGAAGAFSFSSRSSEAALLNVRGWGPIRVAMKAAVEASLPVIAGAVGGLLFAYLLVRTLGPHGPVERSVLIAAVLASAVATIAAIVVIGAVGGVMFAAHHERAGRHWRFFLWVPWELIVLGAVLLFGRTLRSGGALVGTGDVQRPGAALSLYPVACAAAAGILVARAGAVTILRRSRAKGGWGATARWLALRRVASSIRLAAVFLVTAAIAVSVAVSAQGLVSSLRTTVVAKAEIFVGSDVQAQVVPGAVAPTGFPYPATVAERVPDAGYFDAVSTDSFQLLVIDPSTFARAAFWESSLSDVPLDELLTRLDAGGSGALPIVIANGATTMPTSITVGTTKVPVTLVGRTASFPGYSSTHPLVVVSRDQALRAFPAGFNLSAISGSTTELWIRGPTGAVLDAIRRSNIEASSVITADEVRDIPFIVSVVNTFLTLNILGAMALLLVVVLAIVYLHVRQRARVTANGLSSRMGASFPLLRRALILELGGILLGALAIGVPTGLFSSSVVLRSLDPLPLIPPRIFFAPPWAAVAAIAFVLLAATIAGGWFVDRAARKADLSEVMRVAE
jgi:putative ABC transport system permease protein